MLAFVVGLNRPFCLEDMFPRLLSSRIPGGQGTIIRVPSWWHFALALPQRLTLTLVFALLRASLRQCVDSIARPFATAHRALACLLAVASRLHSRPRLALASRAHALPHHMPQAPIPWVSRWWLFQPHQRARRWRYLWLVQEQHPRPAALPLIRARGCSTVRLSSRR